ncbi:MAG: GTP-binding protein [Thermoplasmata archaeon]|nr:MAG: GTP-binding protein [Thermoplasmata archaeon]
MDQPVNVKFKVCLLGDGAVGKTSLIRRFVEDMFNDDYLLTIGTKTTKKRIIIKKPEMNLNIHLTLIIWDIMGQVSFRKLLHPTYLKGAKGAIIVCDLTRKETLQHFNEWIESLRMGGQQIPSVFVANKCDLKDQHTFGAAELESVASTNDSPFLITSAKTGENVERAFQILAEMLVNQMIVKNAFSLPGDKPKRPERITASNYQFA